MMSHIDPLEPRRLFSVTLRHHLLTIAGTAAANTISLATTPGNTLRVVVDGAVRRVPTALVRSVAIEAGGGDDVVTLSQAAGRFRWPVTIVGGAGNDVLAGGAGDDLILGGRGRDSIDGGAGDDNFSGNAGVDTVRGGAGVDTFHDGDTAGERADQSAEDRFFADEIVHANTAVPWAAVNDFTYQLQAVDLAAIGRSKFDLAVIDTATDDGVLWTKAQITALQKSPGGPKRVLAYVSIGEAENYRPYWQKKWDANNDGTPDNGAPGWLAKQNPEWEGNYTVHYWDPAWQKIVFKTIDAAAAAGFDGVYLDIVDAFETWGPDGNNQRPTAEQDMVNFVKAIAAEARRASGHPSFAVVPQNGETLGTHKDYLAAVTAIGHEDVFYDDDTANDAGTVAGLVADLDRFKKAGKPVFVVDYPKKSGHIDRVYAAATSHEYVAYCPRRGLDRLTVNAGHEPD